MNGRVAAGDGAAIACWRRGSGPALVLVHGSGADHRVWDRAGSILAGSFAVVAIDRRGHGASDDAPWRGLETDVEDVGAALAAAGPSAALLGHSYGALCCLEAVVRGAPAHRLVLCEPPLSAAPWPGVAAHLRERLAAGDREAVVTAFYARVVGVPGERVRAMRALPSFAARVAAAHTLVRELDALEAYELRTARLAAVRTPTLLLLGGRSPGFLRAASLALGRALPCSRLEVLDDQRHLAMEASPGLFAGAVRRFLRE